MDTFDVEITRTVTLTAGWAAWFMPIWDEDEDGREWISTVESGVTEVSPATVRIVGNVPCVQPAGESWWLPCSPTEFAIDELRYDDTHDLRNRIFAERASAEEHVREITRRFAHPQPWESFVQL